MNQKAIADAEKAAEELIGVRTFMTLWDGYAVWENYYGDSTAETTFHLDRSPKALSLSFRDRDRKGYHS